jgi:hypothetical protein
MAFWNRNKNPDRLRVIKTARDTNSINKAAKNGLLPLVKKVQPSNQICSKYAIVQNKISGEIKILTDYRDDDYSRENFIHEKVIDWTFYYPHNFTSPFAAYLIPDDIQIGERVFLEDLIEDYVGAHWNQGDTYRLESCEAIWNGSDLEIQYNPTENRSDFVG